MAELRKYGVSTTLEFPLMKRGVADLAVGVDWTPAAGDVKISKDGGAAANVTNLPVAKAMGNTATWEIVLTATEMQAARIAITIADAATKVVEDDGLVVETYGHASAQHEFDLDAASVAQTGDAYALTNSRLPAALVSGRMDSSIGAVASGVIAAASFAAGALDAVWSTASRTLTAFGFSVTVGTNNDKTGYALSSAGVQAIWDALTSALTTVGSVGKRIADNLDATISSRAATGAAMTLTSGERDAIADAKFDRANGVETGMTERQALRGITSALFGKASGAGTSTEVLRNAVADTKARVTYTVDASGNRTAVATDLT